MACSRSYIYRTSRLVSLLCIQISRHLGIRGHASLLLSNLSHELRLAHSWESIDVQRIHFQYTRRYPSTFPDHLRIKRQRYMNMCLRITKKLSLTCSRLLTIALVSSFQRLFLSTSTLFVLIAAGTNPVAYRVSRHFSTGMPTWAQPVDAYRQNTKHRLSLQIKASLRPSTSYCFSSTAFESF